MPTLISKVYWHCIESLAVSRKEHEHSGFAMEGTIQEMVDFYFAPNNETTPFGRAMREKLREIVRAQLSPRIHWSAEEAKRNGPTRLTPESLVKKP
jgi:hypothetical protein